MSELIKLEMGKRKGGKRKLTNAREGESGGRRGLRRSLDGGGAAEEDEAGAVVLGGGHGGEGVAAPGPRRVLRSVPVDLLHRTVGWGRHHPCLLA